MDAFAVELDRELPIGTPVVLIGRGVLAEEHARVADTITYELVCGISSDPARARRVVVDGWTGSREPRDAGRRAAGRARRGARRARARVRPAARATSARSTSAPARARSRSRSRRSCARSSASTAFRSCSRSRASARLRTSSSSKATRRACRSPSVVRPRRRRCGRCTTSRGPSSCSPSSTRVTRPGGRVLVVDQLAPSIRSRRSRSTASSGRGTRRHTRLLPEIDLRQLFEANGLVLLRERYDDERRELGAYLDLAGCEGEAREAALDLAPHGPRGIAAGSGLVSPGALLDLAGTALQPIQRPGAAPFSKGSALRSPSLRLRSCRSTAAQGGVFPGDNGLIAYTCGANICTFNPDGTGRDALIGSVRSVVVGRTRRPSRTPTRDRHHRRRRRRHASRSRSSSGGAGDAADVLVQRRPVAYVQAGDIYTINSDGTGGEQPLTNTRDRGGSGVLARRNEDRVRAEQRCRTGYDIWTITVGERRLFRSPRPSATSAARPGRRTASTLVYGSRRRALHASPPPASSTPTDLDVAGNRARVLARRHEDRVHQRRRASRRRQPPTGRSRRDRSTRAADAQPDWQEVTAPPGSGPPRNVAYPTVNLQFGDTQPISATS